MLGFGAAAIGIVLILLVVGVLIGGKAVGSGPVTLTQLTSTVVLVLCNDKKRIEGQGFAVACGFLRGGPRSPGLDRHLVTRYSDCGGSTILAHRQ